MEGGKAAASGKPGAAVFFVHGGSCVIYNVRPMAGQDESCRLASVQAPENGTVLTGQAVLNGRSGRFMRPRAESRKDRIFMKFSLAAGVVLVSVFPLFMNGCVAGNRGSTAGTPTEVSTMSPRDVAVTGKFTAVVSVEGSLPAGARIGGVDVTLNLPPGVSVKTEKDGQILPEVVTLSGGATGSLSVVRFTPATDNVPGQLRLAAIKTDGFDAGQFAVVTFEVMGAVPKAGDFSTSALLVIDEKAKPLSGFRAVLRPAVK